MEKVKVFLEKKLKSGATQTLLAKEIGISQGAINKLLRSEVRASTDTLEKLAHAYKVPVSQFFDEPTTNNATVAEILNLVYELTPEEQQHILTFVKAFIKVKEEKL